MTRSREDRRCGACGRHRLVGAGWADWATKALKTGIAAADTVSAVNRAYYDYQEPRGRRGRRSDARRRVHASSPAIERIGRVAHAARTALEHEPYQGTYSRSRAPPPPPVYRRRPSYVPAPEPVYADESEYDYDEPPAPAAAPVARAPVFAARPPPAPAAAPAAPSALSRAAARWQVGSGARRRRTRGYGLYLR